MIVGATGAATPLPVRVVGALTVGPTEKVILLLDGVMIVGAKAMI